MLTESDVLSQNRQEGVKFTLVVTSVVTYLQFHYQLGALFIFVY